MKKLLIVCFSLFSIFHASAQSGFTCLEGTADMPEGGTTRTCEILSGSHHFTVIPPFGFDMTTDKLTKNVSFKIPDTVFISIQFTTDFPGRLPGGDVLKRKVLQKYVGAAVLQSAVCYTGSGSGWMVDVKRVLNSESSLTTRHVFVSYPGGSVEFVLSTNSEDFEQYRNTFGQLLNSFHAEPYTAEK